VPYAIYLVHSTSVWLIEIPGWFLLIYLVLVQGLSAFNHDWGVRMGVQETQEQITHVGVAFGIGCARADVAVYIPLLAAVWWDTVVGMTLYWPLEYTFALPEARSSWDLGDETAYWIFLPIVALWAFVALGYLALDHQEQEQKQRVE
jgi:hypothetical protein